MEIGIVIVSLMMSIFWGYIIIHFVMSIRNDISHDTDLTFIAAINIILVSVIMLTSFVCLIYLIV